MPVDYECSRCGLHVTAGWYHYHSFTSGYAAATLGYCIACGAQHEIEIAHRQSGNSTISFVDCYLAHVPDGRRLDVMRLLRADLKIDIFAAKDALARLPLRIRAAVMEWEGREVQAKYEAAGAKVLLETIRTEPDPNCGPLRKDRLSVWDGKSSHTQPIGSWKELHVLGERTGTWGEFSLSVQRCGACGAVGTIRTESVDDATVCPICHEPSLRMKKGWIT